MMEAARTSEMLVNFYQTTRHYNPEDSDFSNILCCLHGVSICHQPGTLQMHMHSKTNMVFSVEECVYMGSQIK
jgi:hypothetical protein